MSPRNRHYYYYSRRSKRGNSAIIDSLPDDLLLEILVRVSAEDIHENARFVCRKWKRIIHGDGFVYSHLHRTTPGLLLVKFSQRGSSPTFVAAAESGIQKSELKCKFNFPVLAGCNGLILGMEGTEKYGRFIMNPATKRFIMNPATKRRFDLPQFSSVGGEPVVLNLGRLGFFSLTYAAVTMEYKVVATWCDCSLDSLAKVAILTVGVDKTWRKVPFKLLSGHAKWYAKWRHLLNPKFTEGFIHWAKGNDVLSMNVETEVITESRAPLPQNCLSIRHGSEDYHMSTGRHLSAMISCGDFEWEVWEMKPESGEWRKLVNKIDLKAHKFKIREFTCEIIRPVCWVTYHMFWPFRAMVRVAFAFSTILIWMKSNSKSYLILMMIRMLFYCIGTASYGSVNRF